MSVVKMDHIGTVRPCDLNGCKADGLWKPIVHFGNAEAVLDLRVCSGRRRSIEPSLFIEIAWRAFQHQHKRTGQNPPSKDLARVTWDKWHPGIIIVDA